MERSRPKAQNPDGVELTAEESRQILKRASELERPAKLESGEPALELAELEKIGLESGMTREAIQRAYLELRLGKLNPPREAGFANRWLGPESVAEERLLALPLEDAQEKLDAEMKNELMHAEERQGERTTWTAAPGLWATIQRGMNWQGQSTWRRTELTSELVAAPPGLEAKSRLKLEARPGSRSAPLVWGSWAGLFPALISIFCFSKQAMDGCAVMAAISVIAFGIAFAVHRRIRKQKLRALRLGLTRVLDRISGRASGRKPELPSFDR